MNVYDGVTVTPSDLGDNETASTFNNVTFNQDGGGEDFEGINFSFSTFTGTCVFNAKFKRCNFVGSEGGCIPSGDDVEDCNMNTGLYGDRSTYIANRPAVLELTTDAIDSSSPIDGIPDITANGTSTCTITVTKKDADGNVVAGATDVITLETSRGRLDELQKALASGSVSFTLTSAQETCIANLKAVSAEENVLEGSIYIQFAP